MTDKLNEQVSALLDNELSDQEAYSVLAKISQDQELRQKWERYHLIGDVMHGEVVNIGVDKISERVKKQIELEPAIISIPQKSKATLWKKSWIKPAAGAALAASVASVVVLNAPGFLGTSETAQPLTAANINTPPPKQFVTVANVSRVVPAPVSTQVVTGNHWKNLKEPSLESRLNGYLVNHSEYAAPGTSMRVMPYATFVGYDSNSKINYK